jgi:CubicO group peptidase (beta-lactamase class C family)
MDDEAHENALDEAISRWSKSADIVGAAAGIVQANGLIWSKGYGFADLELGTPFDPARTIMNIASISKVITASTVMRAVEEGCLELDDPIDQFIDFQVRHPDHSGVAITVRHLLSHTSGIADSAGYKASYMTGDPDPDVAVWLRRYLDTRGDLFVAGENWHPWEPGDGWAYSSIGTGLLAPIVEAATGVPFHLYSRNMIFRQAGMGSTAWFRADVDMSRHATLYSDSADLVGIQAHLPNGPRVRAKEWQPVAHYGWPTYPDGMVRTSLEELSFFAREVLAPKAPGEGPMLQFGTIRAMLSDVVVPRAYGKWSEMAPPAQGLGWRRFASKRRRDVWGHGGRDPGVRTLLLVDVAAALGVILMTNTSAALPIDVDALLDAAEQSGA